jgi:phosphotransferase system enzyme I (PtsP)
MIEVPAALLEIERIVSEVDFVSVGTNDLVQYLLAVDRDNSWVSGLYDPHHPAVLRALGQVASAASGAGKLASVCGDVAGDPATAVLLLGMGYSSVSTAPQFIPEIKYAVRRVTSGEAQELAREALSLATSSETKAVLNSIRARLYPRREDARAGLEGA